MQFDMYFSIRESKGEARDKSKAKRETAADAGTDKQLEERKNAEAEKR